MYVENYQFDDEARLLDFSWNDPTPSPVWPCPEALSDVLQRNIAQLSPRCPPAGGRTAPPQCACLG